MGKASSKLPLEGTSKQGIDAFHSYRQSKQQRKQQTRALPALSEARIDDDPLKPASPSPVSSSSSLLDEQIESRLQQLEQRQVTVLISDKEMLIRNAVATAMKVRWKKMVGSSSKVDSEQKLSMSSPDSDTLSWSSQRSCDDIYMSDEWASLPKSYSQHSLVDETIPQATDEDEAKSRQLASFAISKLSESDFCLHTAADDDNNSWLHLYIMDSKWGIGGNRIERKHLLECYCARLRLGEHKLPVLLDRVNKHGETPLFLAVRENVPEFVKCLLEQGADPTVKCFKDNLTPLQYAVEHGNNHIIESMLTNFQPHTEQFQRLLDSLC